MDVELELERALAELQRQQDRIADMQEELASLALTGSADRGAVTVTMTGDGRFTEVRFDPVALREHDADSLGEAVLTAINDVMGQLAEHTRERFGDDLTGAEADAGRPSAGWSAAPR